MPTIPPAHPPHHLLRPVKPFLLLRAIAPPPISTCQSSTMEAGYSGKAPAFTRRRPTYRSFSSSGSSYSPRSGRFYNARFEEAHHFLDACYLCKKQLSKNKDIFMYRGDTPFCSEDCRQEQIEMDEAREKNYGIPIKASSSRSDAQSSASKDHDYHVRTGTVAAG